MYHTDISFTAIYLHKDLIIHTADDNMDKGAFNVHPLIL